MKLTWKNKSNTRKRSLTAISSRSNLPFEVPGAGEVEDDSAYNRQDKEVNLEAVDRREDESSDCSSDLKRLAESFQAQGDRLAEDGKFREALGKWENALTLMPGNAVLHEQKAQVLLEAWITLGRAQLNFGEPDSAIESFDRALAIKPDSGDARGDRQTALHLIKRRKQLHSAGLSSTENRYLVRDKSKDSDIHEE
ncbi:tetratricopeptide repeat protein 33 isoform X2 [Momordica charantia]|uniref:Tetratricopeptide repeat protein 33 isoform X2 n=1 Tax=Momordica charantia TaxID=3673 RepID=A0A6J1CIW1_MOMCH|nr:tetratricopeptide repeat protein 33 isoform X2 [Momordica charantia]